MKSILISILFLFLDSSISFGQKAVRLNCIEVLPNGNITISWTPPDDVSGFLSYEIFYSTNENTFTKIAEINTVGTNQYIDLNTNANGGSRYYYINSVYNNDVATSNTLMSMFLEVDNNDPSFNQADLKWNAISEPLPLGSSAIYTIYEKYPLEEWFEKLTTTSLSESFEVIVCNDFINFRIEMYNNDEECKSVSNIAGAIFKDAFYPIKPVFDSVSIDIDGHAILGWEPSESLDVEGYIIYYVENSSGFEFARVYGRDYVSYVDATVDPCTNIFSYSIATFDICGNISPRTDSLVTLLIENIEFDVCSMSNTISWTPYTNAQPSLDGYKIFCSVDEAPFSELAFVVADTMFGHSDLEAGKTYNYFVQAIFGNKSSSSCKQSVTTYSFQEPQFVYLANATVLPTNNEVELTIDVDALVNECTWEIWSTNKIDPTPSLVTSISSSELTGFPLVYTDESVDAATTFFTYFVVVIDSCGNNVLESNQLTTIKLSGSQPTSDQNQLDWTAFKGWEEGVEKYYIFRLVDNEIPTLPFDSVSPTTLTYQDDIASIDNPSGVFGYWVQAKQNPGNLGYQEESNSNRIYIAEETTMYMANAFRPGGITPEYMPVYQYFTGSQYLFQIYNRWGQLIFETSNPSEGWTGQMNGSFVPLGVYVYRLVYNNLGGQSVVMNGTVTVVY